ncbi:MAG: hypothetical protein HQK77_05645 [Desulfobacterales bacterium]|nr:hypothetical protein [Desulfobacterales bacterium]
MGKINELKDYIQESIDNGATTVEEIHKSLANKPFEFLERIHLSGERVARFQDIHHRTIGNVYEFIRTLNRRVGEIATDLLIRLNLNDKQIEMGRSEPSLCKAVTKLNKPCKNKAIPGSEYCYVHKGK